MGTGAISSGVRQLLTTHFYLVPTSRSHGIVVTANLV